MSDFFLKIHEKTIDVLKLENHIISPYSIYNALGMLYLGSGSSTKQSLETIVFGTEDKASMKDIPTLISDTMTGVEECKRDCTFINSNAIYYEGRIVTDFERNMAKVFKADSTQVPFSTDLDGSVKKINQRVAQVTNGLITAVVNKEALSKETRIVLVNAVYFKGEWAKPFFKQDSFEADFYCANGREVKTEFMRQYEYHSYARFDALKCHAMRMEFKNSDFRCNFILPLEGSDLGHLYKDSPQNFDKFKRLFHPDEYKATMVDVTLPKFKMEHSISLKDAVSKLGLQDLFSPKADISHMLNDKGVRVYDILHKAVFEINEEGAEAAAATACCVDGPIKGKVSFIANEPFIFALTTKDGLPVFIGHFMNPV